MQLQRHEKTAPENNDVDQLEIPKIFLWDNDFFRNADEKRQLQEFLVENHAVFAKHCSDVAYNTEPKIKITPEQPPTVSIQSRSHPINMRYEYMAEMAFLLHFIFMPTLSNCKESSPIYAHRKSSSKLRLLFDMKRIILLQRMILKTTAFLSQKSLPQTYSLEKNLFVK